MDSYGTSISNTSGTSSGGTGSRSNINIRALGPNKTGDEEDEDDEACKIAEMPEELKHARFKVRDDEILLVPPTQTRPVIASLIRDLSGLARRTTWSDTSKDGSSATNTTDVNTQPTSSARLGLGPVLDPTKILPSFHHAHDFSPHISTDDRAGEKPDGYVRPDKLIVKSSAREKYGAWMDEAVGYHDRGGRGEGVKERSDREPGLGLHKRVALPDVFSTAHLLGSRSNGNMINITLFRDPSSPIKVYVSPCPTVALEPLGQAARLFDDKFDCLLSPVKYLLGNFNSNVGVGGAGFGDVPLEDRSGSVDRDPVGVDRERVEVEKALRAGVPVGLQELDLPVQGLIPYMGQGRVIPPNDLQQVISAVTRSLAPAIQLAPGCHAQFPMYNATFHTHPPKCVGLYAAAEGDAQTNAPEQVNAGQDMQYVAALTGAMGVTFSFTFDPRTRHVSAAIYLSWQFWPERSRRSLIEMTALLLEAVRPSFVVVDLVKRGIAAAGWELPVRVDDGKDSPFDSPACPGVRYKVYRIDHANPAAVSVWKGYADAILLRMEQGMVDDLYREMIRTRLRPAFIEAGVQPPPYRTPAPAIRESKPLAFKIPVPAKPLAVNRPVPVDLSGPVDVFGVRTLDIGDASLPDSPPAMREYDTPDKRVRVYTYHTPTPRG